jgi:hypothetical protein
MESWLINIGEYEDTHIIYEQLEDVWETCIFAMENWLIYYYMCPTTYVSRSSACFGRFIFLKWKVAWTCTCVVEDPCYV